MTYYLGTGLITEIENITPQKDIIDSKEDQDVLNDARKIRGRFNFKMVKIPIGAELYFSRDDNIKTRIINTHGTKSIEFDGKKTSLSQSAQEILGYKYGVAGTDYWMYDGETFDERRRNFESVK